MLQVGWYDNPLNQRAIFKNKVSYLITQPNASSDIQVSYQVAVPVYYSNCVMLQCYIL